MIVSEPRIMPPPRKLETRPRVALVLGGGAFHGIAHVGVLKVLEDAGIPIDLIVGTSAGSLVGCMYADQPVADSLLGLITTTKAASVFDFSLFRSLEGFVSGKKLEKFILKNCKSKNIEDLKIPFVAVATDLISGVSISLSSGPVVPSVITSCAIPMVFEPVKMYGYILADGGILNNVAADVAATFNPEMIIAVDIMANHHLAIEPDNFLKVGLRALLLMTNELKSLRISIAEVAIVPNLTNIPYMSGRDNQQAFEAGMHAARANLH